MWVATRERDLCVLYLNLMARLAAQICQEQTGDSKRKWKDEGPVTVGHKQLKLTVTLLSIVRKCTAVCVALTLCTIANHKSQLARPNQAVNVLLLLSLWSSCLVLFVLCVLATAETHSTFGKRCCPLWFATYCMLRLCGSCGLDPSLLAKFHLNTANVIELPRHLLLAMILLLQSPFASQSVWLCGCWVAVAATVAVAKKLSLAAPPPPSLLACHNLFTAAACLASLCVYNYLHKLQ